MRHDREIRRRVPGTVLLALAILLVTGPRSGASGADRSKASRTGKLAKYDTRYYIIHSDLDIDTVREAAARMTTMAETYHQRTKGFAGQIRSKFPFYLFRNTSDYYQAGGLLGSAGVFIRDQHGQRLMVIAGDRGKERIWHIVQHEAFHQFAFNVITPRLPIWVNEGLAEYFGHAIWTGDGYVTGVIPPRRLARVRRMIGSQRLLPFVKMLTMTNNEWTADLSARNYDQAWSMVHFLVHAEDGKYRKAFGNYINDVARRKDPAKAFAARLGRDLDAFARKYADWWNGLPPDPTADLQTQAVVATLTSFVARTKIARVKVETFEEFAAAAREGKIQVSGKRYPRLWLPQSLVQGAIQEAPALGQWSLDTSGSRPELICKQSDGTVFRGSFTLASKRAPKVTVRTDKPQPQSKPATDAPGGAGPSSGK